MIVKEKKWGNKFAFKRVKCDFCERTIIFEKYSNWNFMRANKCKRCKDKNFCWRDPSDHM